MGRNATRSAFAAALCAGVAMVGASVHGLLGVDAELQQRSALAAQYRTFDDPRSVPVSARYERDRDCPGAPPARDRDNLS
jgi:hypothetical protein